MDKRYLNNRYVIQKSLGAGGMGEVYKAIDSTSNRFVAVKRLKSTKEHHKKRFQREYIFLKTVDHPNLIKAYDYFEQGNEAFIVLEFVVGRPLKTCLTDNSKEWILLDQLSIAHQTTRAVEILNIGGIIHRDIKPENIMVNEEKGLVKLLDLGVAKNLNYDKNMDLTLEGSILGTLAYLSPEQANGKVGEKSDIFSLGTTLYQFFTWSEASPFHASTAYLILHKLRSSHPPDIYQHICGLQPDRFSPKEQYIYQKLSQIIGKAMEKEPENRWENAGVMADQIAALQKQLVTTDSKLQLGIKPSAQLITTIYNIKQKCRDEDLHMFTPNDAMKTTAETRKTPKLRKLTPKKIPQMGMTRRNRLSGITTNKATRRNRKVGKNFVLQQMLNKILIGATLLSLIVLALLVLWQPKVTATPASTVNTTKKTKIVVSTTSEGTHKTLEEALKDASPNTNIYLSQGVHRLSTGIAIPQSIGLIGEGMDSTILEASAGEYVLKFQGKGTLRLHKLSLHWKGTSAANGLLVTQGTIDIKECSFRGAKAKKKAGICLLGNVQGSISQCRMYENRDGIIASGNSQVVLKQNRLWKNLDSGIVFEGKAKGTAINNKCFENECGIFVGDEAQPNLKENETYKNKKVGITFGYRARGTATNNICRENKIDGILVFSQAAPLLEQNKCTQNGSVGIVYSGRSLGMAHKNTCVGNGTGIYVEKNAQPTLMANTCQNNKGHGICYTNNASGMADSNICNNNNGNGIYVLEYAQPSIVKNRLWKNRYGILVRKSAQPLLEHNHCIENRASGIAYKEKAFGSIRNNICQKNAYYGIEIRSQKASILQSNSCAMNGKGDIFNPKSK